MRRSEPHERSSLKKSRRSKRNARRLKALGLTALICAPPVLAGAYVMRNPHLLNNIAGPGSTLEKALAKLPFVDKAMCLGLPQSLEPFDTLDKARLKQWIPRLRYVTNPQHLAIDTGPDDHRALRQRFVPSDKGSERVIVSVNLQPSRTYEVRQSVMFEPGFDWGGEVESGKFGFGFGGGSAPTGGTVAADGFSARLMWKGHGDTTANVGAYLYSVDRTQNLPYGDEFVFPEFTIPQGEWFQVKMRLTTNSSLDANDGALQIWINEELLFTRDEIQWQSEGDQPMIDQVLYSAFHGGNTAQWSPENEVYARLSELCVYK